MWGVNSMVWKTNCPINSFWKFLKVLFSLRSYWIVCQFRLTTILYHICKCVCSICMFTTRIIRIKWASRCLGTSCPLWAPLHPFSTPCFLHPALRFLINSYPAGWASSSYFWTAFENSALMHISMCTTPTHTCTQTRTQTRCRCCWANINTCNIQTLYSFASSTRTPPIHYAPFCPGPQKVNRGCEIATGFGTQQGENCLRLTLQYELLSKYENLIILDCKKQAKQAAMYVGENFWGLGLKISKWLSSVSTPISSGLCSIY